MSSVGHDEPIGTPELADIALAAPSPLALFAGNGSLLWCNPAYSEQWGESVDRLLGVGWRRAVSPDDAAQLCQSLAEGRPFVADLRLQAGSGPARWTIATGAPRDDGTVVVAAADVTAIHRIAEVLQRSMLPEALPDVPEMHFRAHYLPGGLLDVGGDWYDVVTLPGERYGIAIGDVAGHGLRAATVMGQLRNTLRVLAAEGRDPAATLARLNRFVLEQGPHDLATVCCGVLDVGRRELELSVAAHLPPLVIDPDGSARFAAMRPAPPIGVDSASRFGNTTLHLEPGTTVILYTDGLVERRGESLDTGLERLRAIASVAPPTLDDACAYLVARLLDDHDNTIGDDVALLGMRFLGPVRGRLRLRRPARAAELAPVRRILGAWLETQGLTGEDVASLTIAVSEVATNAIEHAYDLRDGVFELEAYLDHEGAVNVLVRDFGRWRHKALGGGGRGLMLARRLMDDVDVRRRPAGTEVWMRRSRCGV